jgi:hypothetical protein
MKHDFKIVGTKVCATSAAGRAFMQYNYKCDALRLRP